jgi:hypothetical protein
MDRQGPPTWIRCAIWSALIGIAAAFMTGCKSVNWMGEGFHDEFAHWGEKERPAGQSGNLVGLSEQAQEVERNLGVR